MCNSNVKSAGVAQIAGRPVLQPAGNRVAAPEIARPLKKSLQKSLSMPASYDDAAATCAAAPKSTGAGSDFARAAAATPYLLPPKAAGARAAAASVGAEKGRKAPKKASAVLPLPVVTFAGLEAFEAAAGSIAAAQREHVTQAQAQRKSRIAHYGRTASFSRVEGRVGATTATVPPAAAAVAAAALDNEKRCSFITPYSDPVYVAYHDEEWGVPVHDDELLFEMLTLSGVQVGADWASILRRRHIYREAFSGFDVDAVAKYTEKQMASVSAGFGLDLGTIRAPTVCAKCGCQIPYLAFGCRSLHCGPCAKSGELGAGASTCSHAIFSENNKQCLLPNCQRVSFQISPTFPSILTSLHFNSQQAQ